MDINMDLQNIFGIHETAANLKAQRSEILSSNLANADTPNFKARDIDFEQVLNDIFMGQSNAASATHPSHMSDVGLSDTDLKYRVPLQASQDGNTVDVQVESGKFTENHIKYMASLRLIDFNIRSLHIAIKGE